MQTQTPKALYDYFGQTGLDLYISQTYTPGKGWTNYPGRKRVSITWLRKLKAEGVTSVAIRCGTRFADFTVAEVIRKGVSK